MYSGSFIIIPYYMPHINLQDNTLRKYSTNQPNIYLPIHLFVTHTSVGTDYSVYNYVNKTTKTTITCINVISYIAIAKYAQVKCKKVNIDICRNTYINK